MPEDGICDRVRKQMIQNDGKPQAFDSRIEITKQKWEGTVMNQNQYMNGVEGGSTQC